MPDMWRIERIKEDLYFTTEGKMCRRSFDDLSKDEKKAIGELVNVMYEIINNEPTNIPPPPTTTPPTTTTKQPPEQTTPPEEKPRKQKNSQTEPTKKPTNPPENTKKEEPSSKDATDNEK